MDNAQKAIMIGVGLFITIIIIAAVMLITGIGQDLLNQGTEKAGNVSSSLTQQETAAYDNTKMTGSRVISAVKKYYNDTNIAVQVKTNGNNVYTYTPYKVSSGKLVPTPSSERPAMGDITNSSSKYYISPTTQYTASLIKNAADGVIGINFTF